MKDWKVLTLVSFQVDLTVLKGRLCLEWVRRCLWTSKRTGPQFCVTEAVFRVFFAETSHPNITNYFLCVLFIAYNLLSLPFPDRARSLGRIQNLGWDQAAPSSVRFASRAGSWLSTATYQRYYWQVYFSIYGLDLFDWQVWYKNSAWGCSSPFGFFSA